MIGFFVIEGALEHVRRCSISRDEEERILMRISPSPIRTALMLTLLLVPAAALAQDDQVEATAETRPSAGSQTRVTSSYDRLFLSFVEDAVVVENQWWEGQFEYSDGDGLDVALVRGIVAFNPWENWEMGARIGFGRSDSSGALSDGTGATDLDVWGKYYLGRTGDATEFTGGGILTLPTGDDGATLGTDAWALNAFGALRQRFRSFILSVSAGVVFNGDGQVWIGNTPIDTEGRTAPRVSGAAIFPWTDRVSFVAEAKFEGERFRDTDSDIRLLGGANWRVSNRGQFRGAIGFGFTDASPNWQLLASYAFAF
jgi:hypothetical protein